MTYEKIERDETLSNIDEGRNTMPNTKAGSSKQFQKGGKVMTIAQIVESWLAGGSVPPPSEQSPENSAVVYVAEFVDYGATGETIALVNKEEIDDQSSSRSPTALWLEIPLDQVAAWVNGIPRGEHFDVRARRGTLRLERWASSNPEIARLYVHRRDTKEDVAYTDAALDGEDAFFIEADAFEALQPFRGGARVLFVSCPDFVFEHFYTKEEAGDASDGRDD